MSASTKTAGRNGDRRTSPEEYRRAVKLTMRKQVKQGRSWVDAEPTDEEVNYLLLKAAEYGLNPLKGQIYATWRGGTMQVETTLDGLRVLAEQTGQYRGQLPPEWYDEETSKWTDVWTDDDKPPAAARVGILRKGFKEPVVVTVHWREFKQTTSSGQLSSMWQEKPAHMLAKNSASLGFRAAFPGEAGGIYTAEEMAGIGQMEPSQGAPPPQAPPASSPTGASNGNGSNGNGAAIHSSPPSNGQAPAVIVDPPSSQPSGPPATPATSGRLAAVLEKSGYSRLREDLARLVFDQQASRLNEEQTGRLANALTAAESAGITAVELERACKRGLKYDDVPLRRKALFQWIAERAKKAGKDLPSSGDAEEPAADGNGQGDEPAPASGRDDSEGAAREATAPGAVESESDEDSSNAATAAKPPPASPSTHDEELPAADADGGPAATVDSDAERTG